MHHTIAILIGSLVFGACSRALPDIEDDVTIDTGLYGQFTRGCSDSGDVPCHDVPDRGAPAFVFDEQPPSSSTPYRTMAIANRDGFWQIELLPGPYVLCRGYAQPGPPPYRIVMCIDVLVTSRHRYDYANGAFWRGPDGPINSWKNPAD